MAIIAERRPFVAGPGVTRDELVVVEDPADESSVAEVTVTPLPKVVPAVLAARRRFDEGVWADPAPAEPAAVPHRLLEAGPAPARRRTPREHGT